MEGRKTFLHFFSYNAKEPSISTKLYTLRQEKVSGDLS
jgi:hypothetical protein